MTTPASSSPFSSGSSVIQAPLWSARSRDWAEIQEPQTRSLYVAVLKALSLPKNTRLLDAGCGSGVFCELAAHQGAFVTGLDASDALLEFARRRVPQAAYISGELEQLPFLDAAFNVVTGFNAFQYANSPSQALAEAFRVLRPGGRLVMATWGTREQCQASAYLQALGKLLPPPPPGAPGPFALSEKGVMAALISAVGFEILTETEVPASWEYSDESSALRGMLSAGPAVRAIQHAGETQVLRAVGAALAAFKQPRGGYRLENTFRYAIAKKPRVSGPNQIPAN